MCELVEIDGRLCATQGELSEALGGPLVMNYGQQGSEYCLCPVNMRLTALRFRRSLDLDGDMWKLTPNV